MMSLQKDNDMMADEPERDGAVLAAPNFKNDGGLEAHNDNKNYLTDVPDLVGAGRRFRPSPTISSGHSRNTCSIFWYVVAFLQLR